MPLKTGSGDFNLKKIDQTNEHDNVILNEVYQKKESYSINEIAFFKILP